MKRRMWTAIGIAGGLVISLFLVGCNQQQGRPPAPTPEVAVVTVSLERVTLTTELPGRTAAYLMAEIRPQVNGLIQKRHFIEGSQVKANEPLYQIDPAPYQAALDNANANLLAARKAADRARAELATSVAALSRHQATLTLAKTNYRRYEDLLKVRAVSTMERDQGAADVEVAQSGLKTAEAQVVSSREGVGAAEAAIKQAEAALETARINLGYTKITAPITGRIGRSNVTEGAIVTAYQGVPLATIQQFDPIYVDVPQSTTELNRLRRSLANGRLKDNGTDRVKIVLEDGSPYPLEGSLKFRDVTVDPTMGTVILRIVVPNPEGILLPNMFVRAIVDEGVNDQAILVPQQAVSRDPKGNPMALVVDAEGKVQQRSLSTDRAIGDRWLVTAGLAPGDRVVVEGMQKVRPGVVAKVVAFEADKAPPAKPDGTARNTAQLNQQ
jgi:membrane fusion protein (multidrug efflux system)